MKKSAQEESLGKSRGRGGKSGARKQSKRAPQQDEATKWVPQEAKHWNTKDGKIITTEEEVLVRLKEYFYEILNVACEETELPEGCKLGVCEDSIEMDTGPSTIQELRQYTSSWRTVKLPVWVTFV